MKVTTTVRAMALSDPQWQSVQPKRELVFPVGQPPGNDERQWCFTPEDLSLVEVEFKSRTEPAPVYYCHGEDPARGKMAAGWIDKVELAADGLYAFVRYTETALAEIQDGAWGYRSPGFDAEQDAAGCWHPRKLTEVSLVNDPAIGGMPPIQAQAKQDAPASEPVDSQPAANNGDTVKEETDMDSKTSVTAAKQKAAAFDKAGLLALVRDTWAMPDAISDEVLIELIGKTLMSDGAAPEMPAAEKEPENPAKPPDEPIPALASAKPRIELVEDEGEAKAKRERVKSLVAAAVAEGKVTEATFEGSVQFASVTPDGFKAWADSAPVIAPASGQLVKASAADRKPMSNAERLTARYRNEAARPHFTQRGN